jgi:hypothetical protein
MYRAAYLLDCVCIGLRTLVRFFQKQRTKVRAPEGLFLEVRAPESLFLYMLIKRL